MNVLSSAACSWTCRRSDAPGSGVEWSVLLLHYYSLWQATFKMNEKSNNICFGLIRFELFSFLLNHSGDCGCNQGWLLHRTQHISLHTFLPTHTPPHTLFLCSYIKNICTVGRAASLCYISNIQLFGFTFNDHAEVQKSWRQSAGGCCRVWNVSLLIHSLTEVHHSHCETHARWGIVWVRLPTTSYCWN